MSYKRNALCVASLLASVAFATSPAFAGGMTGFSGLLSGDYANVSANHGGNADVWGVSGSGAFGLGENFVGEVDTGYQSFSGHGSVSDWTVDGSVFWRASNGRIGLVVGYNSVSGGGFSANATNYGVFGEWFATPAITLGLKGGGFSGNHGGDGSYVAGAITGYVMPDLSFSGGIDYTNVNHFTNETDWSIRAEYLFSEKTPISVWAGYVNSHFSGGLPSANTWIVGLTLYCNGPDTGTALVDRQRGGPAKWGTSFSPLAFSY